MAARKRRRLEKGEHFKEGSRLLWLALHKRSINVEQARKMVGCAVGTLDRVLYGDKLLGLAHAVKIEKLFGVPVASWRLEPKKPFDLPEYMRVA